MISLLLAAGLALTAPCDLEKPSGEPGCERAAVDSLPMTAMQVIGTHNSYKRAIAPGEMTMIRAANPKQAAALDYAHPPLTDQLNAGARQLELDLLNDPEGGRYATPLGLKMAGAAALPYDLGPLKGPGFKVMHAQDIDYRSTCATFVACLREIAAWSKAHPDHVPLLIMMNLKEGGLEGVPGATLAAPWDAKAMDQIDADIRSVFPERAIITPDKVQGKAATLAEGARAGGWPRLKTARGKVMFAMDEGARKTDIYRGARKSLEGRAMFINTDKGPAAAYVTLNEPLTLNTRIDAALANGLIVRTRADADTLEARTNDRARQTAAFASGAHYISTDYMTPDTRFSAYEAHLPGGGVARLNPKRAK